jgi:hypothetical protein
MKKAVLGFVAGLVLAVSGIALASIPDSSGVIHGCYRTSNPTKGAVTVIDSEAGGTCPSGTVALNWNQTGPQGPPGLSGVETVVAEASLLGGQNPRTEVDIVAQCPTGKAVIGGGFDQVGIFNEIDTSRPSDDGTAWFTHFRSLESDPTVSRVARAYAVCAFVQ